MSVEIRELVIRATVAPDESGESAPPADRGEARRREGPERPLTPSELERVVSLCTSRVLRSMKRAQER